VHILKSHLLADFDHGFGTRAASIAQDRMASLKQIHSAVCIRAESEGLAGEGDALITNRGGLAVSIRTADCLPILLADPKQKAVAAVHAGWRGTVAKILIASIDRMRLDFGSNPRDIVAAIGPGIGECCYEVGDDVAKHFGRASAGCVNLAEANRKQLMHAGVRHIDILDLCTFCEVERFHSFRRDKDQAGRMIFYIAA